MYYMRWLNKMKKRQQNSLQDVYERWIHPDLNSDKWVEETGPSLLNSLADRYPEIAKEVPGDEQG